MTTFLVTGGTGRIGTECIAQLASQGHRVKFATRNPGGATARFREKFGPGTVRAVGMDVNDAASIDKASQAAQVRSSSPLSMKAGMNRSPLK